MKLESGVLGSAALVVLVFGVAGNGMVAGVFARRRKLLKRHFFVVSLSLVEVLAAISYLPIAVRSFADSRAEEGSASCSAEGFLVGFAAISAVYIMSLVSVERYLAICHPLRLRRWTSAGKVATVGATLLLTALINAVPLIGLSRFAPLGRSGRFCCFALDDSTSSRRYFGFIFVVGFALPASVITLSYGHIWHRSRDGFAQALPQAVKKSASEWDPLQRLESPRQSRKTKAQTTILRTSVCVVLSFMGAWLPFAVASVTVHFRLLPVTPSLLTALEVTAFLAKLFVLYNPLMYGFLDGRFRDVVFCRKPSLSQLNSSTGPTSKKTARAASVFTHRNSGIDWDGLEDSETASRSATQPFLHHI